MLNIARYRPKNLKGKCPIRAPVVNTLGLHPWFLQIISGTMPRREQPFITKPCTTMPARTQGNYYNFVHRKCQGNLPY